MHVPVKAPKCVGMKCDHEHITFESLMEGSDSEP